MARSGRAPRVVVGAAVLTFVAGAFPAAWQAGRYGDMQRLVADPDDDMAQVYGGLAKTLGIRRVVVQPGPALAEAGHALPFHAVLTLARHTYAYDGSVPLLRTAAGWRVDFDMGTIHPSLQDGQTLRLRTAAAPATLLDRSGRPLSTDGDLSQ